MAFGIGALIGGLGSMTGGIIGALQARRTRRMLNRQRDELTRWRNGEIYSNYLDRADSRDMLKNVRDMYNEQAKKQVNANIKGGASDEYKTAQANTANKGLANMMSRIGAIGQRHKDSVESSYRQQVGAIDRTIAKNAGAGAVATANAISGAAGVIAQPLEEWWQGRQANKTTSIAPNTMGESINEEDDPDLNLNYLEEY